MMFKSLFFKNKKENGEAGRSMVEMLGVLAIIGVLSIGGIAGYNMAMNRYRANEIIDTAAKVSVIAISKQDCDEWECGQMSDVTDRSQVSGITSMSSYGDGRVGIYGHTDSAKSIRRAIKSIAGNKVVEDADGGVDLVSMVLNFEM